MHDKDGLNLPLARDGECASQGAAAAGSTDRPSGAPDRERARVPAETSRPRKSEFLLNVSHEIRTPLKAILGLAESLSNTPLSTEQRTMVRLLRTAHAGQVSTTVSVATRNPGGLTLHFVVIDAGIGIPKDWQADVFQPFVQVDASDTRTHTALDWVCASPPGWWN